MPKGANQKFKLYRLGQIMLENTDEDHFLTMPEIIAELEKYEMCIRDRYSVMHGNEQLFASKYKLYLPTEEELREEIETQKTMFYLQQKENKEQKTD